MTGKNMQTFYNFGNKITYSVTKKCQYILAHSYAEQCPQFFLVADLAVSSKTDN